MSNAVELFDTHAHIDDEQFDLIRDAVIDRASDAGVKTILAVGTTADSSEKVVDLASRYDGLFSAVGIQPNYCAEAKKTDWDRIVTLVSNPRVVALGETGLDRHWDHTPFNVQQDYFDRHLKLSQQCDLPFIVHMRDCGDDVIAMLQEAAKHGPLNGVMHSYAGDVTLAEQCVDLGLYISFAGMVTYKKSQQLRDIATAIPNDRLLIETDSPYLSPHPKRGQRPNEPALVVHTAKCLADARGVSLDEFARTTTTNAKRLFSRTVA